MQTTKTHTTAVLLTASFRATPFFSRGLARLLVPATYSDWHKGYPDCGKKSQSPIDLAADLETVVKVSDLTPLELQSRWGDKPVKF